MRKNCLLTLLIFLFFGNIYAQKFDFSYGILLGPNGSFISPNVSVDYSSPYWFGEVRNIGLSTSTQLNLGYNGGLFFIIKPIDSKFNLETGFTIANYNNKYTVSLYYEYTHNATSDWITIREKETVENKLNLIKVPIVFGYNLKESDYYKLTILLGGNLNLKLNMEQKIGIVPDNSLYKDFLISYLTGIRAELNKLTFCLVYERSLDMQNAGKSNYFFDVTKLDNINLNVISLSIGLKLDGILN